MERIKVIDLTGRFDAMRRLGMAVAAFYSPAI
jgi:hypothetical protein